MSTTLAIILFAAVATYAIFGGAYFYTSCWKAVPEILEPCARRLSTISRGPTAWHSDTEASKGAETLRFVPASLSYVDY